MNQSEITSSRQLVFVRIIGLLTVIGAIFSMITVFMSSYSLFSSKIPLLQNSYLLEGSYKHILGVILSVVGLYGGVKLYQNLKVGFWILLPYHIYSAIVYIQGSYGVFTTTHSDEKTLGLMVLSIYTIPLLLLIVYYSISIKNWTRIYK